ncbi:putative magnesium transporter NIPA [Helianthus anomalus]
MVLVIVGEIANFAAYAFAPAILVMSVKAIGIALKLNLLGMNQLVFPQTWAFTLIVLLCVITQMNYIN